MTDSAMQELIAAIVERGDEAAVAAFLKEYQEEVCNWIRVKFATRLRDAQSRRPGKNIDRGASDIYQSVGLQLLRKVRAGKIHPRWREKNGLRKWLQLQAQQVVQAYVRRAENAEDLALHAKDSAEDGKMGGTLADAEFVEQLRAFLGAEDFALLERHHACSVTLETLAEQLGCSVSTVKRRPGRVHERIRERFANLFPDAAGDTSNAE